MKQLQTMRTPKGTTQMKQLQPVTLSMTILKGYIETDEAIADSERTKRIETDEAITESKKTKGIQTDEAIKDSETT